MAADLDFYFDYSSPFGFFMAEQIDALAAKYGRGVTWRPFLLGAFFKRHGGAPLPTLPVKGPYSVHDFVRSGRFYGLEVRMPAQFPTASQHAARAHYWLWDRDPALAKRFSLAVYRAYFQRGGDIAALDAVLALAAEVGADADALRVALEDPTVKDRLRAETEAALDRGVFGSPMVYVDDEPFWGADRLPQIERWLETGGF